MRKIERGQLLERIVTEQEFIVVKVVDEVVFTVFYTKEGIKTLAIPNKPDQFWTYYELIGHALVTNDMDEFIKVWAKSEPYRKYFEEVTK